MRISPRHSLTSSSLCFTESTILVMQSLRFLQVRLTVIARSHGSPFLVC